MDGEAGDWRGSVKSRLRSSHLRRWWSMSRSGYQVPKYSRFLQIYRTENDLSNTISFLIDLRKWPKLNGQINSHTELHADKGTNDNEMERTFTWLEFTLVPLSAMRRGCRILKWIERGGGRGMNVFGFQMISLIIRLVCVITTLRRRPVFHTQVYYYWLCHCTSLCVCQLSS